MTLPLARVAAVLALVGAGLMASPASARPDDADEMIPTLVVSATGTVEVPADQVEVWVDVETEAKTAVEALSQNEAKATKVRDALKALGLTDDEVTTSRFSIQPRHDSKGYGVGPIVGYSVSNAVLVRTKRMDLAGKIIQSAVNAGANRIGGVSFGLSGDQGRQEALMRAAQNARADAMTLASASGVRLGRVQSVTMNPSFDRPIPFAGGRMAAAMEMGGAPEPSLTPGTIPVRMTVVMEFRIEE